MRWLVIAALSVSTQFAPAVAHALDPFEIQVYDGTASGPGVPGLELHANRVFHGLRISEPPEAAAHHQTHLTLEPSLGLTPFWELGAYLQSAFLADGSYDYAGVKLRSKFVIPPGVYEHLRLGVNLEVSFLPHKFDRSGEAIEVRPIIAWEDQTWLFAANPIVGLPLGQPGLRDGPTFEPALMALYKWRELFSLGVEYYSDLGSFASGFAAWSQQQHYLFEAFNLLCVPQFELNLGIGEGLTAASNPLVVKLIVGYEWETVPE